MRLAVFANVQGNAAALRAVIDDAQAHLSRLDSLVCAGDVVGLGPEPNQVLELLRENGIPTVRGNYDDAVAAGKDESGMDFPSDAAATYDAAALGWTRSVLAAHNLEYLQQLPRDLRLLPAPSGVRVQADQADERQSEYRRTFFLRALFGGLVRTPVSVSQRILVLHGSPRALNEFVREDTANSILEAIAKDAQFDLLISAHAGVPFRRDHNGATFIGAGRVSGAPNPAGRGYYAVITTGDPVDVEFREIAYDAAAYRDAVRNAGMPTPAFPVEP
ncbi:MAG TPA: metallophosphoesterase family protein [Chloroflexota bacterium]|nr:metallophosphoesterase family protein [Chloroflexota bacterium]